MECTPNRRFSIRVISVSPACLVLLPLVLLASCPACLCPACLLLAVLLAVCLPSCLPFACRRSAATVVRSELQRCFHSSRMTDAR